ncbi:hydrolase [Mycobacterium sp. 1245111.1]|uniref:serine hydrolase domain-containing protein n=1 Tax=Mycobacterium sp. 1245111.1 TaxID=1834073 RepID=UPI0007FE793C|nr:serine hydrolase [Mycobacterium sp. 1245111.1]OBK36678.1 hydrolase [Mycobacterium sp. 1245111.1]
MSEPTPDPPAGISLHNWLQPPYSHWSFQHVEDFVPTAVISRGSDPAARLSTAGGQAAEIAVTASGGRISTVGEVMRATATDGWAVAHRGRVVVEQYFGGMRADTRHLVFSVSKSLVGAVVGVLHGSGVLDLDAPVTTFVPALANSGYAGATVRHLLDMRSGIGFSEDYSDPDAEIHLLDQAMGWAPKKSLTAPSTVRDFLLTLRKKSPHGGPFEYRSCETDVLGWICEVAGSQPMPDLMSECLWSRIGAEHDATIALDPVGTGFFDGGVNAALIDLIRFGSLFLHDGASLTGSQVLPAAWIADTLTGGPDSRRAFAANPDDTDLPGGMYRNQMWVPYAGSEVVLCLGMCGQMIYVNRPAQMVAAKVSAQRHSHEPHVLDTLRAFDAVAHELG